MSKFKPANKDIRGQRQSLCQLLQGRRAEAPPHVQGDPGGLGQGSRQGKRRLFSKFPGNCKLEIFSHL